MTWLQPYPGWPAEDMADSGPGPQERNQSRETIELAFITALQLLPPRQAAVLVLRDVLGFSASEVATMLSTVLTLPGDQISAITRFLDMIVDVRQPDSADRRPRS